MGQGKSEHAINVYMVVKNTALDILHHGGRRGDSESRLGRFIPEENVPGTNCAGSRSSMDGLEKDIMSLTRIELRFFVREAVVLSLHRPSDAGMTSALGIA